MAIIAFLHLSLVVILTWARKGLADSSVGCFMCQSFNQSDTGCEDPFHPAFSHYDPECKQGMPGRVGLFLASFCIKMSGTQLDNGHTIMVRSCSLENMGHQCGIFEFENKLYKGCLTTCHEDACNAAPRTTFVGAGGGLSKAGLAVWTAAVSAWLTRFATGLPSNGPLSILFAKH